MRRPVTPWSSRCRDAMCPAIGFDYVVNVKFDCVTLKAPTGDTRLLQGDDARQFLKEVGSCEEHGVCIDTVIVPYFWE